MPTVDSCLVVGSSRGLGAALVGRLLASGVSKVIGLSRTRPGSAATQYDWAGSDRYHHLELDISAQETVGALSAVLRDLPAGPLLVIYNAAAVKSDLSPDGTIDFAVLEEINAVGVSGFAHLLRAVEPHLRTHGGVLVGISSFSALAPPVRDPRLGYPASKAYLDMALRSLRRLWKGAVRVVTVHLGSMSEARGGVLARLACPSYDMAAERIVRALNRDLVPEQINYPLPYSIAYRCLFPLVPDSLYFAIFGWIFSARAGRPRR